MLRRTFKDAVLDQVLPRLSGGRFCSAFYKVTGRTERSGALMFPLSDSHDDITASEPQLFFSSCETFSSGYCCGSPRSPET